jgi:SAM-dependent methyltransferase
MGRVHIDFLRGLARQARYALWRLDSYRFRGDTFTCPICRGSFRTMKPFVGSCSLRGVETDHYTENAICPRCHSVARQRFVVEYLRQKTDLLTRRRRILHFAPEISIYNLLRRSQADYVAADIEVSRFAGPVVYADATNIPFPDASFDAIICIHVLEHIVDDRKAIAEFFRVLKPGGQAIVAVPTYGDVTYEDPDLDAAGRERQYGAAGHVRLNGIDFADKLTSAGFAVKTLSMDDVPGNWVDRRVRSPHTESDRYLFVCAKPLARAD